MADFKAFALQDLRYSVSDWKTVRLREVRHVIHRNKHPDLVCRSIRWGIKRELSVSEIRNAGLGNYTPQT